MLFVQRSMEDKHSLPCISCLLYHKRFREWLNPFKFSQIFLIQLIPKYWAVRKRDPDMGSNWNRKQSNLQLQLSYTNHFVILCSLVVHLMLDGRKWHAHKEYLSTFFYRAILVSKAATNTHGTKESQICRVTYQFPFRTGFYLSDTSGCSVISSSHRRLHSATTQCRNKGANLQCFIISPERF